MSYIKKSISEIYSLYNIKEIPIQIRIIDSIYLRLEPVLHSENFELYASGSSIRDIFDKNEGYFDDIDLYFTGHDGTAKDELANIQTDDLFVKYQSEKESVTSYKVVYTFNEIKYQFKLQLITGNYSSHLSNEIMDRFTFRISKFLYDPRRSQFVYDTDALPNLKNRKLVLNNELHNPWDVLHGIVKYNKHGFKFHREDAMNFFKLISVDIARFKVIFENNRDGNYSSEEDHDTGVF